MEDLTQYKYTPDNCPEHRWCKFYFNLIGTNVPEDYVPTQHCMDCGATRPITEDPNRGKMVYLSKNGWKYEDEK